MEHLSEAVIHALREQGYEVHDQVMGIGGMQYGVRSKDHSAWVNGGKDLTDLAAGRVTLEEFEARNAK
jgi:hypothetical protein